MPGPPPHLQAAAPGDWLRTWGRVLAAPSVKNTGFALLIWADYKTGANIYPGNETLCNVTGLSDKAVRDALKEIRGLGFIWRYLEGRTAPFTITKGGERKRPSDEYRLTFPCDISAIPMLSPDWEADWKPEFLPLWITPEHRYSLPLFTVRRATEHRYSLPLFRTEHRYSLPDNIYMYPS